jgi:GcrA cell cycle regulator
MIWTAEAETELRRLWGTGDAASQIGKIMGCTRSAILGKAHRLGLSDRIIKHALGKRFKKPREPKKPRQLQPQSAPPPKPREMNARPAQPTKKEMREMLTLAVLNTGGHL